MKNERTRDLQTQRIDRTKANRPKFVDRLPDRARAGDMVVYNNVMYIFDSNVWQEAGVTTQRVEQQIAQAPAEAQVNNIQTFTTMLNVPASILQQYQQGRPARNNFGVRWYADANAYTRSEEIAQAQQPRDISFIPATPTAEPGTHLVTVTFTPTTRDSILGEVYLY